MIKFEKTLVDLFEKSVDQFPNNTLLLENLTGEYQGSTYREVHTDVHRFGAGLVASGIKKGDRIGLIADGRNDWLISELGILYAGAINVPLSVKLDPKTELKFRLAHSGAKMVIVSESQAEKIEAIRAELPELEKVVYLDGKENPGPDDLIFSEVKTLGAAYLQKNRAGFNAVWTSITPDDYANISYTSGTTADPKGIILSHKNYAGNVMQANTLMKIKEDFVIFIILPWDHSFAHTAGLYSILVNGATIASVEVGKTPQETLRNIPKNIRQVRPHFMLSVPAIAKNFRKNIEAGIAKQGPRAEKLFRLALKTSYAYQGDGYNAGKGGRFFLNPIVKLFDKILYRKIRDNFGGRLEFFIGGGALLDTELQRFFYAIGIPMCQGYGLSESSPVISSNTPNTIKFGSSGKLVKFLDLKICDEKGNALPAGEKGEIVVKGDNVMVGYWKNEKSTNETIKNGWLHTGDMGYMSEDGYLYVLGRFKSLLIGNDGEKFSPEGIEEALVDQSPCIEQCMLYNNQNPYTSGIFVPSVAPLKRELEKRGHAWEDEEGVKAALKILEEEINHYRKGGKYEGMFPERWLPSSIAVLPESFNEQNQLMNSTMKIVRSKIVNHFAEEFEFLYQAEAKNVVNEKNINNLKKWN